MDGRNRVWIKVPFENIPSGDTASHEINLPNFYFLGWVFMLIANGRFYIRLVWVLWGVLKKIASFWQSFSCGLILWGGGLFPRTTGLTVGRWPRFLGEYMLHSVWLHNDK